ncbi:MAG: hypothetical protein ACRD5E_02880 [Nitrososphaeraceae archaeon]
MTISDLSEINSGEKIYSTDIKLKNNYAPPEITPGSPRTVSFSIDKDVKADLGDYQGSLFVKEGANSASIPISYDVMPPLAKPVILVVDGVAISIAFWKVIAFLNSKYTQVPKPSPKDETMAYLANPRAAAYRQIKVGAVRYAVQKTVFGKNLLLDGGTLFFGIILGLIALPSNEAMLSVHTLGGIQIVTLIVIGLGLGSLKEFITRIV